MASSLIDVCRFNPTAGGTTDWTYSSAVTGYQSPSAAGAVNGATYSYRAESADLTQWEIGTGVYNSGTGVITRAAVLFNSSGTTSKINFSATPQVAVVALAEDIVRSIDTVAGAFTISGLLARSAQDLRVLAASKSDQQTGTSTTTAITPAHQQDHDSAAKAWVNFVGSSGSIATQYNVSSVVRNSAGAYTINFTVAFASAAYACFLNSEVTGGGTPYVTSKSTGSVSVQFVNSSFAGADPSSASVVCYGRQ